MGVPLLLTWLKKRFADCFLPADSAVTDYIRASTDNLFIDLNSFLYQAATIITVTHRSHRFGSVDEVEDVVLRKLFDLLDDLVLNLVQPKALVYIAVDGVSPLGKMSQQRARRRRGARRQPTSGPSSSASHHGHHHHEPAGNMGDLWDGNCISVGTRFMAKVTEALHFYAVSRTERINARRLREERARVEKAAASAATDDGAPAAAPYVFPFINIIVDDVLRPGEGENKIAEFIRRIRSDPGYGPNTSHVICSSDTDVTVTSLILHEPRIHVLRYEPPVSLGGKPPARPMPPPPSAHGRFASHGPHRGGGPPMRGRGRFDGRGGGHHGYQGQHHGPPRPHQAHGSAASAPAPPKDSWLSTFFSIHVFRQRLRDILRLAPADAAAAAIDGAAAPTAPDEAQASLTFEHALHDVVFVLLLFGNDFLPTIGGSIQEGTLDALLTLLATDFVPRGNTLVDPTTNRIQYESARYLLSRLAELPGNARKGGGTGGRLQVHNGGSGALEWGFTTAKEGRERDPGFVERQQRREKQQERMCYCYWTMLQWALQYSAGIVEHWGCYYPYGKAPPLSKLATYCGVLTYDALGEIARRRLEVNAAAGRVPRSIDAEGPEPAGNENDEEEEEDGMDGVQTAALRAGELGATGAVVDAVERGKPTDVMVQLLILIPPRSVALLPTVFRHRYSEVAEAVQAPVEQLNLASIGAWCEEKKRSLSEVERTRFTAYQFFASDTDLGTPDAPFPAHDIAFSAYWDGAAVEAELDALRADRRKPAAADVPVGGAGLSDAPHSAATAGGAVAAPVRPAAGLQSKAASFFSMGRRPAQGGAAALLASVKVASASPATPATPPPSPLSPGPEAPATVDEKEEGAAAGASGPTTEAPPPVAAAHLPVSLRHPAGDYVLWVAPCAALKDALMVRALGTMQGTRFCVGSYVPLVDQDAVLSRGSGPRQEVRLQFRLAVVPAIRDMSNAARLLPGYEEPAEVGMRDRIAAARKVEADRNDPWKQLDKLQTLREERKRARGEDEADEADEGGEDASTDVQAELAEGEASDATGPSAATAATKEGSEPVAEAPVAAPVDDADALLQRRKEEARRRLAALKAARLAAQQDG